MEYARLSDRIETSDAAGMIPDVTPLVGTWINANPDTSGIARVVIGEEAGEVTLQVFAIGLEGLIDWGREQGVTLFAGDPASDSTAGFTYLYDFGFAETLLQGNINKGLLVLAQFHRFKDDSGRADYFTREYFALTHDRF